MKRTPLARKTSLRRKPWRKALGTPELRHGTLVGYSRGACRCEDCRQAYRDYYGHRPRAVYLAELAALKGKQGKGKTQTCARSDCGNEFYVYPSQIRKYCSRTCAGKAKTGQRPLKGETRICAAEGCENEFYNWPYNNRRYCSQSCASKGRKVSRERIESLRVSNGKRRGARNPNFRHGERTDAHMRAFGHKVRAEGRCRACQSSKNVHGHHAVPRSLGTRDSRFDARNCLPLCASCHMCWHGGAVIAREVFTEEEWAYLSSLELTGREIGPWLDKHYPAKAVAA